MLDTDKFVPQIMKDTANEYPRLWVEDIKKGQIVRYVRNPGGPSHLAEIAEGKVYGLEDPYVKHGYIKPGEREPSYTLYLGQHRKQYSIGRASDFNKQDTVQLFLIKDA